MTETFFDQSVFILQKYRGKILNQSQLYSLLFFQKDFIFSQQKKYKLIYFLKLRGYILSLKRNLFLIKDPDLDISEDIIIWYHYWKILHNFAKENFKNKWYLWWLKALEIHMKDYDIRDEVLVVNPHKQATENILFDKMVLLKTYTNKWENLISIFCKYTNKVFIGKEKFQIARAELAILEILYNSSTLHKQYAEELIKKRLRKYKKDFDFNLVETLLKLGKHNSSLNRLFDLVSGIDQIFANRLKLLIKKYGYFL